MYKFDPQGTNPDNIVEERFNISSPVSEAQIWVPHASPFYAKDLEIVNIFTNEVLKYGKDYVFSDDLSIQNRIVESNIYNTVIFIGDRQNGMYKSRYRTVGGGLVFATRKYFVDLATTLMEPVHILYSHVTNVPPSFPPDHHLHDWSDYRNKQYIGESINAITAAIRASDNQGIANLQPLQQELVDISKYLDAVNLKAHVDTVDAHMLRAAQIDALPFGATADEALIAFDRTLSELAEYVRHQQAIGVDLGDYVKADSYTSYVKAIILAGEKAIGTPGNESTMRVVGDNIFFESLGSVDFASNVDNTNNFTFQAGKNVLSLESSPYGPNTDALKFNGKSVMTAFNIAYHLKMISFSEQTVVTKNNDVAIIRGDGSAADPLEVDVILQDATDLQAGVALFTRAWGTSKTLVIESDLVKGLMGDLSGYVPRERKINGFSITDNIVIPNNDPNIQLGNVDNTSDADKPVSTAQQALLDLYSPKRHSHAEYRAPVATATVAGIAKLNIAWTGSEAGFVAPCAFSFLDDYLALSKGIVAVYAGEAVDPNAIYSVIRSVPTVKRGSKINLQRGEEYMVIK